MKLLDRPNKLGNYQIYRDGALQYNATITTISPDYCIIKVLNGELTIKYGKGYGFYPMPMPEKEKEPDIPAPVTFKQINETVWVLHKALDGVWRIECGIVIGNDKDGKHSTIRIDNRDYYCWSFAIFDNKEEAEKELEKHRTLCPNSPHATFEEPTKEPKKDREKDNKISKYFGFSNNRMNCMIKVFEQDGQILFGGNCWDSRLPFMTIDEFDEFIVMAGKALEEADEMKSLIEEKKDET